MSWLSRLVGNGSYENPANAAMPFLNQIPGQTNQYSQPFFEAGRNALSPLQGQYSRLLDNPGSRLNEIGQSYQESPGFQAALRNALTAGNHAAAAGGMAGTPQSQYQQMQTATDLANQDYGNWLQHALGLYETGLQGEHGLAGMGQRSGQSMADMIAQTLAQQAQLSYTGQQNENQHNNVWDNILRGAGALAAFTPWGNQNRER